MNLTITLAIIMNLGLYGDNRLIVIQPFYGFPDSSVTLITNELKKNYKGCVMVNKAIQLPKSAFNVNRTRYRADSLINYLSKIAPKESVILGLTNKDISTTKGKYPDWGVMGLGFCPGNSCIVSSYRLKGPTKSEKLFKVVIHELGHTKGLNHCPDETCIMTDAKGKDRLDHKTDFCTKCKTVLLKHGWIF